MNTKSRFVFSVAAGALALAVVFILSRREGRDEAGLADGHLARQEAALSEPLPEPAPAPTAGVAVRALPPSALGAHAAADRKPPAVPSLADVSAVMDAANESLDARLAALARLGKTLPEADAAALLDFLDRRDADDALPPERLNALKNDVANLLRAQVTFPEALPSRLSAMWNDPGHDEVWRDYCIQHAGAAWDRIAAKGAREDIRDLLWAAASEPAAPGSGTALIALRNVASSAAEDRAKVAGRAAAAAASAEAPEGVRVTSLQIAAELGHPGMAALARTILADRSCPVHLRMSAAAALGQVGNAGDLASLDILANGSNPRLRAAAKAAAARIRSRES